MLIKSPLPGEYNISAWGFIFRFAFASFICEGSEITEHRNSKDETKTLSETKVLLCNHIYFCTSCPMISLRKLRLVLITIFSTVVDLGSL